MKKILTVSIVFFLSVPGICITYGAPAEKACRTVNSGELLEMLEAGKSVEIVDYRMPDNYNDGHIPGAVLLPITEKRNLRQKMDLFSVKWRKNGITGIIVDRYGVKSKTFCKNMMEITGYENIYSLEGGMRTWEGPIEVESLKKIQRKFDFIQKIRSGTFLNVVIICVVLVFIAICVKIYYFLKFRGRTDTLTGLLNAKGFEEVLEQEIARFHRYQTPFSISIIHTDNFLKISSKLGTHIRDKLLVEVAKKVKKFVRNGDICARVEKGKISIIFNNTNIEGAVKAIERLREKLEKTDFKFLRYTVNIQLSAGLVEYQKEDTLESITKLANTLLEKARQMEEGKRFAWK